MNVTHLRCRGYRENLDPCSGAALAAKPRQIAPEVVAKTLQKPRVGLRQEDVQSQQFAPSTAAATEVAVRRGLAQMHV